VGRRPRSCARPAIAGRPVDVVVTADAVFNGRSGTRPDFGSRCWRPW
jgi:hypothetical protein